MYTVLIYKMETLHLMEQWRVLIVKDGIEVLHDTSTSEQRALSIVGKWFRGKEEST